jgi:anti-sigma regulatory factor (Ser/Thr protein kinase)
VSASTGASGAWPAESQSVPAARRLVREHLSGTALADLCDDAELLVSELVANVVLHVGGTVAVTVRATEQDVVVEVTDDSPLVPQVRMFSHTSSTGRGMRLVHSLSAEHGITPRADGKTVWARLTTARSGRADDELAASFADVDWLAQLESEDVDGVTASAAPAAHRWVAPALAA